MARLVLGVFLNRSDAEDAINELEAEGYNPKDISIVMRHEDGEAATEDGARSDVTRGMVSGATTGGVLGALAGLLVGTGVLPGIGALLIGGPLAAALGLTGAAATTLSGAVTGVLAGGLVGVLARLGLSPEDARIYEDRIREGGILVAVPAKIGHEQDVRDIMEDYGADQVRAIEAEESVAARRAGEMRYKGSAAVASEVRRGRKKR